MTTTNEDAVIDFLKDKSINEILWACKQRECSVSEAEVALTHFIARKTVEARLDELIWATGARIEKDDLPVIQERIAELTKELHKLNGEQEK